VNSVTRRTATVAVAGCTALSLALPAVAAASVPDSAAHAAKGTHTIKSGKTTLSVDVNNYLALSKDGFVIKPTGKAKQPKGTTNVTFPVTGGAVNPKKLTGIVKQTGGLSISNGTITIVIKNAKAHLADRDATASVTGKGSNFVALKISKPSSVTSSAKKASFTGYTVSFSKRAVAYLDRKFATKDFKKFARLGTATTKVRFN
jgi:hypothetical protein